MARYGQKFKDAVVARLTHEIGAVDQAAYRNAFLLEDA
jgi:hypothetical protein